MNGTVQNNVKNILIAGVGGQGTLLASKLLGRLLMGQGYDVKVSEVHGMSQRGGSVVTYVKYGEKVYSPVVEEGEAETSSDSAPVFLWDSHSPARIRAMAARA